MNNGQLVTAVLQRVGAEATDGLLTSAVVKSFILEGLNAIEVEREWDWLDTVTTFTTAAGTDTYSPPATMARIRHLRVSTESEHLEPISIEEADTYLGSSATEARGMPVAWTYDSGSIILRPVPDAVYTIQHRYLRTDTELSADGDSPLLPARYQWAVVAYACDRAYRLIGEDARADRAVMEYERWLVRMRDDAKRTGRAPRILVRDPGGL